MEKGDFKIEPK